MLLGASSQLTGEAVNLKAITQGAAEPSGVPAEAELLAFAEAAVTNSTELEAARLAVLSTLGAQALVDAAGVIGNFERMTRIADGTGIPLDAPMLAMTEQIRADLGINSFGSADLSLGAQSSREGQ